MRNFVRDALSVAVMFWLCFCFAVSSNDSAALVRYSHGTTMYTGYAVVSRGQTTFSRHGVYPLHYKRRAEKKRSGHARLAMPPSVFSL